MEVVVAGVKALNEQIKEIEGTLFKLRQKLNVIANQKITLEIKNVWTNAI